MIVSPSKMGIQVLIELLLQFSNSTMITYLSKPESLRFTFLLRSVPTAEQISAYQIDLSRHFQALTSISAAVEMRNSVEEPTLSVQIEPTTGMALASLSMNVSGFRVGRLRIAYSLLETHFHHHFLHSEPSDEELISAMIDDSRIESGVQKLKLMKPASDWMVYREKGRFFISEQKKA